MPSIAETLAVAVEQALGAPALIRAADPRFGDYQANGVMAVAKQRRENPRQLAEKIVAQLQLDHISERPSVEGAGFINFKLKPAFVAARISQVVSDERLGVPRASNPRTVVIDFSSPNVAKPMHVGHIRSTIIGDSLCRVRRYLGERVIADNHLGDWGTQFGMLIVGWKKHRDEAALGRDAIGELERLYKFVNEQGDRDEAKNELVKLQQGDPENLALWRRIIELSKLEFDKMYRRLGVSFDHVLGESFYNPMLPGVVEELRTRGIARESEGAIAVFFEDDPQLKSNPLLIQKADQAFLYGTTDLATLKYRIEQWHPDEIIYLTDTRQRLHFQQVFKAAAKWRSDLPQLKHITFGSILGEDGKPLKTRAGEPVKLSALLDEAEERALAVVTEKNPELSDATRRQIARAVGIGAIKYADLSQNRSTDYVFSWDKMLAMTGNTAPYMQYAYVRVQSIFRKAGDFTAPETILLEDPTELDLAKHILRFGEALKAVSDEDKPNWLTSYLYDLAGKFSAFYDQCPVIQSPEPLRSSRLLLAQLTARVIKQGMDLLGIDVIEQM